MEGKAKFGMPKQNGNKLLSLRKIALLGAIEQPVKISSSHFAEAIESSMQTAARRLQELDTEGLIRRRIIADGQWIIVTKKGIVQLKEECYEFRKIFSPSPNTEFVFTGHVINGMGGGAYYTIVGGYKRQFGAKLGFTPFPDTLNLCLDSQSTVARKDLRVQKGIVILGLKSEKRAWGGGQCYPCKILNDAADEIKCFVIIPNHLQYPENVLEILSPAYLRYELQLDNGDEISVRVQSNTIRS